MDEIKQSVNKNEKNSDLDSAVQTYVKKKNKKTFRTTNKC